MFILSLVFSFLFSSPLHAETCSNPEVEINKSFLLKCDEVCKADEEKKNRCEGLYWKNNKGTLKNLKPIGKKQCFHGFHYIHNDIKDKCGCPWYWGGNKCHSFKRWGVDCSNFCAFEKINPTGQNCRGVYFLSRNNNVNLNWEYTRPVGKMCTTWYGKSYPRSKVLSQCHNCEGIPHTVSPIKTLDEIKKDQETPMSEKTRFDLLQLKKNIQEWSYCVYLKDCQKNPQTGQHRCQKQNLKPCHQIEVGKHVFMKVNGDLCEHWDEDLKINFCSLGGDNLGEMAMSCLQGMNHACDQIKNSQDRTGKYGPIGAWYRNPDHMMAKSLPNINTFSRDMSLGVLAYLIATKDVEAAELWMNFVRDNPRLNDGIFANICAPKPGATEPLDSCRMAPDLWGSIGRVLRFIDFDMTKLDEVTKSWINFLFTTNIDLFFNRVNGQFTRARSLFLFELNLQIMNVILMESIGVDYYHFAGLPHRIREHYSDFLERVGDENPYLYFFAHERQGSEYLGWLVKQYCPSEKPEWGKEVKVVSNLNPTYIRIMPRQMFLSTGAYQHLNGITAYGDYPASVGHDCIELINWILKERGPSL